MYLLCSGNRTENTAHDSDLNCVISTWQGGGLYLYSSHIPYKFFKQIKSCKGREGRERDLYKTEIFHAFPHLFGGLPTIRWSLSSYPSHQQFLSHCTHWGGTLPTLQEDLGSAQAALEHELDAENITSYFNRDRHHFKLTLFGYEFTEVSIEQHPLYIALGWKTWCFARLKKSPMHFWVCWSYTVRATEKKYWAEPKIAHWATNKLVFSPLCWYVSWARLLCSDGSSTHLICYTALKDKQKLKEREVTGSVGHRWSWFCII